MGHVADPKSTVAAFARRLQRLRWRELTPRRSSRLGSPALIAAGGLAAIFLLAGLARYARKPRGWVVR